MAYAQGFDQIAAGAEANGWDIDLGMMATIWRGGCIIRAQFLDRIKEAYADEPDLTTLLTTPYFVDAVTNGVDAWRRVVATAAQAGRADPGVLVVPGLLRRPAPRAAARGADPGRCATTSARTPTDASTGRARSTPRGPATTPSRRCHEDHQHGETSQHRPARSRSAATSPVVRLGYGTMQLTGDGVWGEPDDRAGALRVLRRAVELGVTFFDTADSYGPFVAEELLREALHPYADGVVIATKAGLTRQGPGVWTPVGNPAYLRQQCELSLRRLGLETIDLFQLHRIDPAVPVADQVGELKKLQDEGKIRHIGLSEVDVAQLQEAQQTATIATVQNLFNLANRAAEPLLEHCEQHGIGFIPWFPLATGELSQEDGPLAAAAKQHDATPSQLALAWLLKRSPVMLPIPGTSSVDHLESNTAAAGIELTDEEFAALTDAV